MLTFITFTAAQHRGPTMAPRSPSAAPTRNCPSATWTDGLTEKPSLCNGLEHSGALRDIQEHCPKIQTISLGDWGSWVQIPPLRPTFSVPAHPAPPRPDPTDAGASCPIQPRLVTAIVGIGAAACRHAAFGLPSCLVAILVRRSLACATCGDGGSTQERPRHRGGAGDKIMISPAPTAAPHASWPSCRRWRSGWAASGASPTMMATPEPTARRTSSSPAGTIPPGICSPSGQARPDPAQPALGLVRAAADGARP